MKRLFFWLYQKFNKKHELKIFQAPVFSNLLVERLYVYKGMVFREMTSPVEFFSSEGRIVYARFRDINKTYDIEVTEEFILNMTYESTLQNIQQKVFDRLWNRTFERIVRFMDRAINYTLALLLFVFVATIIGDVLYKLIMRSL